MKLARNINRFYRPTNTISLSPCHIRRFQQQTFLFLITWSHFVFPLSTFRIKHLTEEDTIFSSVLLKSFFIIKLCVLTLMNVKQFEFPLSRNVFDEPRRNPTFLLDVLIISLGNIDSHRYLITRNQMFSPCNKLKQNESKRGFRTTKVEPKRNMPKKKVRSVLLNWVQLVLVFWDDGIQFIDRVGG